MKTTAVKVGGTFAYRLARFVAWFLARFLWRIKLQGLHNVPKSGPFILAPNHRSNVDGPLTCILTRRRMRYVAKSEMFKIVWLGNIYKAMGAIPVNRDGPDRSSLQACIGALGANFGLVLFPEGTRQSGEEIKEIHEGAAYLALRSAAPIVPVAFGFSRDAHKKGNWYLSPAHITCIVGEPIHFDLGGAKRPTREMITAATDVLRGRLQELFDLSEGRRVEPSPPAS